ncbi:MAG TPA: pseudouridine synthase [Herpetosiphonaceae bacterium]|nr:pseudouridine synthase [Herpetosiphonaceae bacterium]
MLDRLHKILARAGVAALRPAEDMILQGRVTVNGRIVRELGARADPDSDVIAVDGEIIHVPKPADPHRYLLLNKPVGVISTARDTHGRPTVLDLVPTDTRIFPVGRLDADSEGLMLLTDDGDLAYRLTHPRFAVDKEYRVLVDRTPELAELRQWRSGVRLPDGEVTGRAWVEVLERGTDGTWLRVVMQEGRKRQIREIARILGLNVLRLIRVREGTLTLGDIPPGSWRELTHSEVEALRMHTQHIPSREADEERERMMSDEETGRPRRLRVVRRPRREDAEGPANRYPDRSDAPATEYPGVTAAEERGTAQDAPARPRGRFDRQTDETEERRGPLPDRREGPPMPRNAPRPDARAANRRPEATPERRGTGRSAESGRAGGPPAQRGFGRAPTPTGPRPRQAYGDERDNRGNRNDPSERGFGRRASDRAPTASREDRRRAEGGDFNQRGFRQRAEGRERQAYGSGRDGRERRDYGSGGGWRERQGYGGGQGRAGYRPGNGRRTDERGSAPNERQRDDEPEINGNVRERFQSSPRPSRPYADSGRERSSFGPRREGSGESRGRAGGNRGFGPARGNRPAGSAAQGGERRGSGGRQGFGQRNSGNPPDRTADRRFGSRDERSERGDRERGRFGQRSTGPRQGPSRGSGPTNTRRPGRPKRRDED